MENEVSHGIVDVGEVRLHCAAAGSGAPLVLLHGFPDFWYGWRHQMGALARAGYRVVAPDLRGYGASDRPRGVGAYALPRLVRDVVGLLETLDTPATLCGHDWGGVIAWQVAAERPDLLERLVILNAPHPAQYRRALLRSTQLLRSWYAGAFQLPWLPEQLMVRLLPRMLRGHGVADADVALYQRAFPDADAFRAPLDYYRAAARTLLRRRHRAGHVAVPTTVVRGERDRYLDPSLLDGLDRWVERLTVHRLPRAGHFVQWDEPDLVSEVLGRP